MLDSFLLIDSLNFILLCSIFSQSLLLFPLFFQVGTLIPSSANIGFFLDKKVMKILQPMKWNFYIIHSYDKFITDFENCFTEFHCSHSCSSRQWKIQPNNLVFVIKKTYKKILCGFSRLCQRERAHMRNSREFGFSFLRMTAFPPSGNTNQEWVCELSWKRDLSEPKKVLLSLRFI